MPTFVGRDAELDRLVGFAESGRSGLALVVGERRIGKRHLLLALRERLSDRCLVLPPDSDNAGDESARYLTVTERTQASLFTALLADQGTADDWAPTTTPRVILLYGYRPNRAFAGWFRRWLSGLASSPEHLMTGPASRRTDALSTPPAPNSSQASAATLTAPHRPTIVVLADIESDVARIKDLADLTVRLKPLSATEIETYLRGFDDRLTEPLTAQETTAYVHSVVADPGLLTCLESVLTVDGPDRKPR